MTTPTTVPVRLQLRADTAANWTSVNPILLANELGRETDTGKIKIGNGTSTWTSLAYQAWATLPVAVNAGGTGQTSYTNGQLLIGNTTGNTLTKATLTAGSGVAITNGTGSITVAVDSTVVTTAQTGTVTSTMIADGTIVDADVNASAAISGTKISPDFGSQNVVTTGTSTAASLIPTGSSVPTNGVYLPAANSVGISTNGAQRATIDSSGRLLVGTSSTIASPDTGGTQRNPRIQNAGLSLENCLWTNSFFGTGVTSASSIQFTRSNSTTIGGHALAANGNVIGVLQWSASDGSQYIRAAQISASVDAVTGQTAGTFVVGTEYRILTTGTTDFTLIGAADSNPGTIFTATDVGTGTGTAIRTAGDMPGRLVFSTTPDNTGAPVERLRISSIGQATFTTTGNVAAIFNTAANGFIRLTDGTIQTQLQNVGGAGKLRTITDHPLAFDTNSVERARIRADGMFEVKGAGTAGVSPAFSINGSAPANSAVVDSSGRLGLGTGSPSSLLHLADAGNITVGTTTGTKIGTATTQKLGFYNATPVVQPTAVADATDAATAISQLNALLAHMRTLGLIAT